MNLLQIKGIGPKVNTSLNKKGIQSLLDLLFFLPIRYEDRTKKIDFFNNEKGYFIGTVIDKHLYKARTGKTILTLKVASEGFVIDVVYFNSMYLESKFKHGIRYVFYGSIDRKFNKLQCIHPTFDFEKHMDSFTVIEPIYSKINGVSQFNIKKYVKEALQFDIEEYLDNAMTLKEALTEIHFPTSRDHYLLALHRFILHEFLMYISERKLFTRKKKSAYIVTEMDVKSFNNMIDFELTKEQVKAMDDIYSDVVSEHSLNRLIQGDVSSGKSIVAYFAIYLSYKNGTQSAYMAPTELLAKQQYESMLKYFNPEDVVLLTSSVKNKKVIYDKIKNGEIKVVVGTHAILQEKLQFNNLSLVVTDEEHRFGVNQRQALTQKGKNVDILMLSATPIPRTLTKIIYSHMDVSILSMKPSSRGEVKTQIVSKRERERVYQIIDEEVNKGNNAYIIYPLIDENENFEAESIEENIERLKKRFENKVEFIHGKMKASEKEEKISDFKLSKKPILVSTTVVEVGIDVSNATIIMIEDANRYGLSQLHQLRGRVGRGVDNSYCFLVSDKKEIPRLEILEKTSDGFVIAKEDLKLRGPGEIRGIKQHGDYRFYKADIYKHIHILKEANELLSTKSFLDKINKWRNRYEGDSRQG